MHATAVTSFKLYLVADGGYVEVSEGHAVIARVVQFSICGAIVYVGLLVSVDFPLYCVLQF